jgi:hypothetical protein
MYVNHLKVNRNDLPDSWLLGVLELEAILGRQASEKAAVKSSAFFHRGIRSIETYLLADHIDGVF